MDRNAKAAIANSLKEILVDLLGVSHDRIALTSTFREDLEADSLDLVEIIMACEDKFGLEISDKDAVMMETVGDVVEYLIKNI